MLQLPTRPEESLLEAIQRKLAKTERKLPKPEIDQLESAWRSKALSVIPTAPADGLTAHFAFEDNLANLAKNREVETRRGEVTYVDGQVGRAVRFSGQTHVTFGQEHAVGDDPFSVALWMRANRPSAKSLLHKITDAESRTGLELFLGKSEKTGTYRRGQTLYVRLVHHWPDNAVLLESAQKLGLDDWHQITVTSDGSGTADGVSVYLNGKAAEMKVTRDSLTGSIANSQPIGIGDASVGEPYKGDIDDLRVYDRVLSEAEVEQLAVHEPIRAILSSRHPEDPCAQFGDLLAEKKGEVQVAQERESKEESRCRAQDRTLRHYYLTHYAPQRHRDAYAMLGKQRKRKSALEERIPTTMVMRSMNEPRETFVLGRGDYRNKGEKVTAAVPAVLPPLPRGAPVNRLGLAKWLVSPSNPLTARVAVNRYWQMYFGVGIVKTAEDFGSQGEAPSHPELLDRLAIRFVESGWDIKALQRLIVTSATYRQSSRTPPGRQAEDPENRRLARGPRSGCPPRRFATTPSPSAVCSCRQSAAPASILISRRACGRKCRSATVSPRRSTSSVKATTSTAAACTASGRGPCPHRPSSPSTRLTERSAACGVLVRTRRCKHSS